MKEMKWFSLLILCLVAITGTEALDGFNVFTEDDFVDPVAEYPAEESYATETDGTGVEYSIEELQRMKARDLHRFLEDRGVECKACTEKEELALHVFNAQRLPKKSPEREPEKAVSPPSEEEVKNAMNNLRLNEQKYKEVLRQLKQKQKQEKQLLERLKAAGFDVSTMKTSSELLNQHEDLFQKDEL